MSFPSALRLHKNFSRRFALRRQSEVCLSRPKRIFIAWDEFALSLSNRSHFLFPTNGSHTTSSCRTSKQDSYMRQKLDNDWTRSSSISTALVSRHFDLIVALEGFTTSIFYRPCPLTCYLWALSLPLKLLARKFKYPSISCAATVSTLSFFSRPN